ncbi:MAG: hypothetical protein BWK73_30535 [Thiothrix lacustris]|uniref:HipA-like kinase domain-containing protein n=1 Tax=Thiothrix lacustris TaxID=525917 RepID=A0A1Y1QIW6_9GAMM|nr:MAG: hypothetical protein BWK73_30535 [Thiothrix lacustris]
MGAKLATAFGLPVPPFTIAVTSLELLELYGSEAVLGLGADPAFASQHIPSSHELKYEVLSQIDKQLRRDVLMFDAWVRNEDRSLTQKGGNPNLLWSENSLYVIDHNLIFDKGFATGIFLDTHVFRTEITEILQDFLLREHYQTKMQDALTVWSSAWDTLPEEWCEQNEELGLFDPEAAFQQLRDDAHGAIWTRLMQ